MERRFKLDKNYIQTRINNYLSDSTEDANSDQMSYDNQSKKNLKMERRFNLDKNYIRTKINSYLSDSTDDVDCSEEMSCDSQFKNKPLKDFHIRYPKNTLNNIYDQVATKSGNKTLRLSPRFNVLSDGESGDVWRCCYSVKWPHDIDFEAVGRNQQEASHSAALQVLLWLRNNDIINEDGRILFSGMEENKKKRKKSIPATVCKKDSSPEMTYRLKSTIEIASDQDFRKLCEIPKQILTNFYNFVSQVLKMKKFKVNPTYHGFIEGKQKMWICSYKIKWPQSINFTATGVTKETASREAALGALMWLKANNIITKEGYPVIEGATNQQEPRRKIPELILDRCTVEDMKMITEIYESILQSKIMESLNASRSSVDSRRLGEMGHVNFANCRQKRVFTAERYIAKEGTILPISAYKFKFISLLNANRVVIVTGEPGCGKSTRIPQYVLENWAHQSELNCSIVVTQPRRIAAISLAERVAGERNENCGEIVGYQVRLNSKFCPETGRILYCTTGILLRYAQSDLSLSSFTHIILDEAHERDVNTDLLMNLLRRTLELNPNLKLVIMSATIDTDLFRNYFDNAPVMYIPGFTFPVTSYFLDDMPGLGLKKSERMCLEDLPPRVDHEEVVKVIQFIHYARGEGAILCFLPGWEDICKVQRILSKIGDLLVMCLHSKLDDTNQRMIFSRTLFGQRKVILSTNIAETSITIDDVVYVVDTGIRKEIRFDNDKGVKYMDNYWVSQSSMTQRKGRAGRVQSGESYHLYTRSKFNSFTKFTDPDILKTSLTKIVLDSKVYSNNMTAIEFMSQLPTPPEKKATRMAIRELKDLELLDDNEKLTSLGRTLAYFQLEPKLAKILVNAVIYKCVTPVVDIVTLFSADIDLFSNVLCNKKFIKSLKTKASKFSDHISLMIIFETWLSLLEEESEESAYRYCSRSHLVHHKLVTINKLRDIHFGYLNKGLHDSLPISDECSDNEELVKAVLFSGVGTLLQHAVKGGSKTNKHVFLTSHHQKAYITQESVNSNRPSFPSDLLVYFSEVQSNLRNVSVIRECSVISPLTVLFFSTKKIFLKEVGNNKVIIGLKDTGIEFLCTQEVANHIKVVQLILDIIRLYYITKLTTGGGSDPNIDESWDNILYILNRILLRYNFE